MSRKNVITPFKLLDAVDGTANWTSKQTNVQYMDHVFMTLSWTGDVTGLLKIYTTNQDVTTDPNPIWVELDFGTPIAVTGVFPHTIEIFNVPGIWLMAEYQSTGGTLGVVSLTMTAKVVGA